MFIISKINAAKNRAKVLSLDDVSLDKAVKIQGTVHDRKRKLSDWEIKRLREYYKSGVSVKDLSKMFGLNSTTVRYNVDDSWKAEYNAKRSGAHTGVDHITFEDRVSYKRSLVSSKRIKI